MLNTAQKEKLAFVPNLAWRCQGGSTKSGGWDGCVILGRKEDAERENKTRGDHLRGGEIEDGGMCGGIRQTVSSL